MKIVKLEERCDICNKVEYSTIFKTRHGYFYDIIKCNNCGLVSIYPKMNLDEMVSYYNITKDGRDAIPEKDLERARKKIVKFKSKIGQMILRQKGYNKGEPKKFYEKILGLLFKGFMFKAIPNFHGEGKILDVGCNNGLYLYLLKNIGWEVFGVDIDSKAYKAATRLGVNCFLGILEEAKYPDNFFDVVRLNHVLEHVSSPSKCFSEARRILKQNGILYVTFPNQRSFGFYVFKHIWQGPGGHLYAFSSSTFKKLCNKFGFKIQKMRIKSSVSALLTDITIWSQLQNRLIQSFFQHSVMKKAFKILTLKPFCFLLNLLGLGDICEAELILS